MTYGLPIFRYELFFIFYKKKETYEWYVWCPKYHARSASSYESYDPIGQGQTVLGTEEILFRFTWSIVCQGFNGVLGDPG